MERAVESIEGASKKALYFYLKGDLQQKANLEINSDRLKVIGFLAVLGFSKQMTDSLDAAEREYGSAATPFELKNSLGHLRSFLEHLHLEAARSLASKSGNVLKDTWGGATTFLRTNGYFSKQEEEFVTALYTLISDESIHPLIAEPEYARLFRNVVIEYGLMFLTALDRKGVKLLPASP